MENKSQLNSLGVMLDCSRNAVMTVSSLKQFIQILAKLGYNRLLLYTEDTYEVDGEAFFGYFRGRYTQEELREIDDYAYSYGIELIPCIQTLAHLSTLIRWPGFSDIVDIEDTLLVEDERTYRIIEKMISSLRKSFRTDKIHIGMDEAYNLGTGKYKKMYGEKDRTELFISHLDRVYSICKLYKFIPMMWSDMFYRIASGDEEKESFAFDESVRSKIPNDVSLVYWDYYHVDESFHDDMLQDHKRLSNNIIYAGGVWKWASFVPNNSLGIESNKAAFKACLKNDVRDVIITLWGDNGAECSAFATLPALAYIACLAFGIENEGEIKNYFREVTNCEFDDFMLLDEPDRCDGVPCNYVINPCKYQLYNDCFLGIYDSGVDAGDGERYAVLSKKLSEAIPRNCEFGNIFDTISKLCNVLEIKSEIGIRTRCVYKNGGKQDWEILLKDYKTMIERTQAFYDAFRKQWFIENKANGFEVHDIRIGGLIMRMKNCYDRLVELRNGTIDSIPELEEQPLPLIQKKELVWKWSGMVSANIL